MLYSLLLLQTDNLPWLSFA